MSIDTHLLLFDLSLAAPFNCFTLALDHALNSYLCQSSLLILTKKQFAQSKCNGIAECLGQQCMGLTDSCRFHGELASRFVNDSVHVDSTLID